MTQKKIKIHPLHLSTKFLQVSKSMYQRLRRMTQPHMTEKIFFLHLPKCGGTSIANAIRSYYHPLEIDHLNNTSCINAAHLLGRDLDDYRRDLLLYYLGQKKLRYVGGHFAYSNRAYHEFGHQWHFITVLRHPVERWFSHYFYNKYKNKDELFRISEDLSTFVDSERAYMLGRLYVRNLTEGVDRPDHHTVNSGRAVATAIKVLEGFSLVGCLEHLDVMKREFEQLFSVRLYIPKSNINPLSKNQQHQQISDKTRSLVEAICKPDLEVYRYALARIGKQ